MSEKPDFKAMASAFVEEPGDLRDAAENLELILRNLWRDATSAERKRQAKNRTTNAMGDRRSPYQPGKLPGR